jgi:trigger factor
MQVSVEAIGTLERRMEVQVPAARIEQAVNERLQQLSRTVRLKGFRPGKVPVKVVRQQFGEQVRQEVVGDVVQRSFAEAVTQEKLKPAGGPKIETIEAPQGSDLKYRATFEVVPEIELKGIEGMEVSRPVVEVTQADIDAMIENLRQQRAEYVPVEREARETDRVIVDFDGTIDGLAFDGGKGEDVPVVLGEKRMLESFETALYGTRAGEQKVVELTFPEDFPPTTAGKQARFDVKIKAVEERRLPEVDEEFAKSFGIEEGGVERLREEVKENMERELAEAVRARLKKQVLDGLLAANPIELPKSMVDVQVRELQIDAARRIGARDASQIPPAENFTELARRRVALTLLVTELVQRANLQVDQAKVQARFEDLAAQLPDPQQALQAYRSNPQLQRQMEAAVLEDQVIDWVLERARITDTPSTFKEVMNFGA